jgi:general stress protein 26
MSETMTEPEKRAHLREVIADFDTAMLVTRSPDGELRGRPMALAQPGEGDATLYFPTSLDSPKVDEVRADPRVSVTMQDKRRFVSVSGQAEVTRERPLIDALWNDSWKIWFPDGKDDATLCLLAVTPTAAEYWDNRGAKGLGYLFESAKALFEKRRPHDDNDAHNAKVDV